MLKLARRKTEDYLRLQASSNTWTGDLGRKGEIDQREEIAGCGVNVKLRTRSPNASCPAMVRRMNNSNDVGSPGGGVGEILYEPRCLHSDVLAAASITNLGANLVGMVEVCLDRGSRLALTTTHQNNVHNSAWPELIARTVCGEANPGPQDLFSVCFCCCVDALVQWVSDRARLLQKVAITWEP